MPVTANNQYPVVSDEVRNNLSNILGNWAARLNAESDTTSLFNEIVAVKSYIELVQDGLIKSGMPQNQNRISGFVALPLPPTLEGGSSIFNFNADFSTWFKTADEEDVIALVKNEWTGALDVLMGHLPSSDVTKLADTHPQVKIRKRQALTWLQYNRPALWGRALCVTYNIKFTEQVGNKWTWTGDEGAAGVTEFDSIQLAAEDVAATYGLLRAR